MGKQGQTDTLHTLRSPLNCEKFHPEKTAFKGLTGPHFALSSVFGFSVLAGCIRMSRSLTSDVASTWN